MLGESSWRRKPILRWLFVLVHCRVGFGTTVNLYSSLFVCPSSGRRLGNSGVPLDYWRMSGGCVVCSKTITPIQGLFCANYACSRRNSIECRQAWCVGCYTSDNPLGFPVQAPRDEDGAIWYQREEDKRRFLYARKGDSLRCPFQCDSCVFGLIVGRAVSASDIGGPVLEAIRRVILDSFWAVEPSTANGTARRIKNILDKCQALDLSSVMPVMGPFPERDSFGYGLAVMTVLDSLSGGRHAKHKQFATVRHYRSALGSVWNASAENLRREFSTTSDDKKFVQRFSNAPTSSFWFKQFMDGMEFRMGAIVKQDRALSSVLAKMLSQRAKEKAGDPTNPDRREFLLVGCLIQIGFVAGLRGPELFFMDIAGVRKHLDNGREESEAKKHVVLALMGRFKGEAGERSHLIPLASETRSGFKPRWWLEAVLTLAGGEGRVNGPLIARSDGGRYRVADMNAFFWDLLEEVQEERPDLYDDNIDVRDRYSLNRSLRRGSDTEAYRLKIDNKAINLMHRWSTIEKAKGAQPRRSMQDHYAEVVDLLPLFLSYSRPL